MQVLLRTLGQMIVLFAVASAVALTANELRRGGREPGRNGAAAGARPSNWIDINRAYFARRAPAPLQPDPASPATAPGHAPNAVAIEEPPASVPYRVVDLGTVRDAVHDPLYEVGQIVLIDARDDAAYKAGRIPGAIQLDYYRLEGYIERVMDAALAAQQVIVYCNGGRCEDSLLVCQELELRGIPRTAIALFKDGWEAWKAADLPIESGPAREQ